MTTVPVLSGMGDRSVGCWVSDCQRVSFASAVDPSKMMSALFRVRLPVRPPPVVGRKPEPAVTPCSHVDELYTI